MKAINVKKINPYFQIKDVLTGSLLDQKSFLLEVVSFTTSCDRKKLYEWRMAPTYSEIQDIFEGQSETKPSTIVKEAFEALKTFVTGYHQEINADEFNKGHQLGVFYNETFKPSKGSIQLSTHEFLGFIKGANVGHNNLCHEKLSKVVKKIDELNIFLDYGSSNPNTGANVTYWEISLEHYDLISLVFMDYLPQGTVDKIDSLTDEIKDILRESKPDSLKVEKEYRTKPMKPHEFTDEVKHIEFQMWWD